MTESEVKAIDSLIKLRVMEMLRGNSLEDVATFLKGLLIEKPPELTIESLAIKYGVVMHDVKKNNWAPGRYYMALKKGVEKYIHRDGTIHSYAGDDGWYKTLEECEAALKRYQNGR